jgi:hypothetical protein
MITFSRPRVWREGLGFDLKLENGSLHIVRPIFPYKNMAEKKEEGASFPVAAWILKLEDFFKFNL